MGGWVSWNYALAHRDRVRALVLVDAAGAPPAPDAPKPDLPIGFRLAASPLFRPLGEAVTPRWLVERSLKQTVADAGIVTPAMVDRYWELLRYPGNRQATIDRFTTKRTEVTAATFGPLRGLPVLIMWGREDRLIPVENAAAFARALPGSRTVIYGGIGHIPMEEKPDQTAAAVDAFLSGEPAFTGTPAQPVVQAR
jgi:pimeloyl-ACP methyl ester carboxylesterase